MCVALHAQRGAAYLRYEREASSNDRTVNRQYSTTKSGTTVNGVITATKHQAGRIRMDLDWFPNYLSIILLNVLLI